MYLPHAVINGMNRNKAPGLKNISTLTSNKQSSEANIHTCEATSEIEFCFYSDAEHV